MKYNTQRRRQRQGDGDSYIVTEMGTCIYTETIERQTQGDRDTGRQTHRYGARKETETRI